MCILFFFSSRRRHTRLVSDWSSDVCSSDLLKWAPAMPTPRAILSPPPPPRANPSPSPSQTSHPSKSPASPPRSEERRVGKECSSRCSPDHYKRKHKKRTRDKAQIQTTRGRK